jgi:hypothetical protein
MSYQTFLNPRVLGAAAILLLVLLFAGNVLADDSPSKAVLNAEAAIKDNQDFLSEHRATCQDWNRLKENNVLQVGILLGAGYDFDFSLNKAVKQATPLAESR